MKPTCAPLVLIGLLTALAVSTLMSGCARMSVADEPCSRLCATNMMEIWWALKTWQGEGLRFPPDLYTIATNKVLPETFVCPCSGHKPGMLPDVSKWTDFIYVGNLLEPDPDVAILISPPENHHGDFGLVVWAGGYVDRVSAGEARSLVRSPWLKGKHAQPDDMEAHGRKTNVRVNVPERLRPSYPDAFGGGEHR